MNFEDILPHIRAGEKFTRRGWFVTFQYIQDKDGPTTLVIDGDNASGSTARFLMADLLTDDWEVIAPPAVKSEPKATTDTRPHENYGGRYEGRTESAYDVKTKRNRYFAVGPAGSRGPEVTNIDGLWFYNDTNLPEGL